VEAACRGTVAAVKWPQVPQSALDEMINRETVVYAMQKRDFPKEYKLNRSTKYPHTPLKRARDSISATLLSQKRGEASIAWIQNLSNRYEDKVDYAKGFEPPGS
jgi:hypothetical protein